MQWVRQKERKMSLEKAKKALEKKGYLDQSLKRYETVYPAARDDHSAVKLSIDELAEASNAVGWVDVTT